MYMCVLQLVELFLKKRVISIGYTIGWLYTVWTYSIHCILYYRIVFRYIPSISFDTDCNSINTLFTVYSPLD